MNTDITANLQSIIKKSISNVICIDEQYVEPYAEDADVGDRRFSKQMYESFTSQMKCKTTLYPYKANDFGWRECIRDQDLLVIDWQLTNPHNAMKPLEIIDEAITGRIPFVCIYTSYTGDQLSDLMSQVKVYFSGYSSESVKDAVDRASKVGIGEQEVRKVIKKLIYSSDEAEEYAKKLNEELYIGLDESGIKYFDYSDPNEWNKLYCNWFYTLPSYSEHCILPEETHNKSIIVDGTYIFFINKKETEIIETITYELSSEPRSIFNVLWIYYFCLFKESIYHNEKLPLRISADALKYHATTTLKEEGEFEYFSTILGMVVDETVEYLAKGNSLQPDTEIVKALKEQGNGIKHEDVAHELTKLNAIMNMNNELTAKEHRLTMGDIFSYDDIDDKGNINRKYLMCVTALCDCAHPKRVFIDKENEYLYYSFLIGEIQDKHIDNPETEYLSYIFEGKNACCIKWKKNICGAYVHRDSITVKQDETIDVVLGIKNYNLTYVCNIKNKYAQRLANDSFSWGLRVGTVYAKASKTDIRRIEKEKETIEIAKLEEKLRPKVEKELRAELKKEYR